VNHYEKELLEWKERERIYSVFANKSVQNHFLSPISGANYRTSKIAILFAFCIAVAWGTLTLQNLGLASSLCKYQILICTVGSAILVTLLGQITWLMTYIGKDNEQGKQEKKDKKKEKIRKKYWLLSSNTDPLHDLEIKQ